MRQSHLAMTSDEALFAADLAWHESLLVLLATGKEVGAQRSAGAAGSGTLELLHRQVMRSDLAQPVICNPDRRLNYGFMAAEALWILSGSRDLAPLTKHVPKMAEYSDDGKTLSGAYGPPITAQMSYVVDKLIRDPLSRQAVLTIWKPSPPESKDPPCTIAMSFLIRDQRLHQHVFMRSSDLWMGVPYDVFSFSLVGLRVMTYLNLHRPGAAEPIRPGGLTITAASSHLYLRDRPKAEALLMAYNHAMQSTEAYGPPYELSRPLGPALRLEEGVWELLEADLRRVDAGEPPLTWRWRP